MKTAIIKISFIILLWGFIGAGCAKEDELLPFHAKGKIIAVTSMCYGEMVLIEVENPKGLGVKGAFTTQGKEINVSYTNAIGVPYFSKIGIPDSLPQTVGIQLYFEYRELTEDEKVESSLFEAAYPMTCLGIYGSPSAKRLLITKIISYK